MAESFTTTNRYFDNKHYPRGILSSRISRLKRHNVERHGHALMICWIRQSEPVTEEEKLFQAACRGEREPVTDAERVWSKYMTRIASKTLIIPVWRQAAS